MKISEIISPESVRLDLTSPSKTSLLQTISEIAGAALGIGASEIVLALTNRQKARLDYSAARLIRRAKDAVAL